MINKNKKLNTFSEIVFVFKYNLMTSNERFRSSRPGFGAMQVKCTFVVGFSDICMHKNLNSLCNHGTAASIYQMKRNEDARNMNKNAHTTKTRKEQQQQQHCRADHKRDSSEDS